MENDREMVAQKFLVEFAEPDGKDVLEIGCGKGRITEMISGWAESYVAVDPDRAALDEAEVRVPGVSFVQGDGEELQFPAESFDVVVFSLSLHHMDAPLALDEAYRVLRPGGLCVVLEPIPFSESGRLYGVFEDESDEHQQATEAMASALMPEDRRELFRTTMTFANADELVQHLFDYYGDEYDPEVAAEIEAELGDKLLDQPLTIHADMLIVALVKEE